MCFCACAFIGIPDYIPPFQWKSTHVTKCITLTPMIMLKYNALIHLEVTRKRWDTPGGKKGNASLPTTIKLPNCYKTKAMNPGPLSITVLQDLTQGPWMAPSCTQEHQPETCRSSEAVHDAQAFSPCLSTQHASLDKSVTILGHPLVCFQRWDEQEWWRLPLQ